MYASTVTNSIHFIALIRFRDRVSFRFLGVRYAATPKRFTYSQAFTGHANYYALSPGSVCLHQPFSGTYSSSLSDEAECTDIQYNGTEDCLYLKIINILFT